jgi:hypothetical protein
MLFLNAKAPIEQFSAPHVYKNTFFSSIILCEVIKLNHVQ